MRTIACVMLAVSGILSGCESDTSTEPVGRAAGEDADAAAQASSTSEAGTETASTQTAEAPAPSTSQAPSASTAVTDGPVLDAAAPPEPSDEPHHDAGAASSGSESGTASAATGEPSGATDAGGASDCEAPPCEACAECDAGDAPSPPSVYDCTGLECGTPCTTCSPEFSSCGDDGSNVCDGFLTCRPAWAVTCEQITAQCEPADVPADSPCAPTEFESTAEECLEYSWVWNGCDCSVVTHCGCASGDCDQIHADYAACDAAHTAQCLPNACLPQDARSNGTMCGTIVGYAFDGNACSEVICGCAGEACSEIAETQAQCEAQFAVCLGRVPECLEDRFPVVVEGGGFEPGYPEFTFSVVGVTSLYNLDTGRVAVFDEWTAATWVGWETLDVEAEACPAITGLPYSWNCPTPKRLALLVGEETVELDVNMIWDFPLIALNLAEPTEVAVKISLHPSGTLVLQIRDEGDGLPVLMVVRSVSDSAPDNTAWQFEPFTFTPAEKFCRTDPGDCNWVFAAHDLKISTAEEEFNVAPLSFSYVNAGEESFGVIHGYSFHQYNDTATVCAQRFLPRQSFFLWRTGD